MTPRKVVLCLVSAMILDIGLSCASSKKARHVPVFTFTPSSRSATSETLTLAIVRPVFAGEGMTGGWPTPQDEAKIQGGAANKSASLLFLEAMARDFQELLSARGYTILGPFKSYDEMTFPQKKQADLVLTPLIKVGINSQATQAHPDMSAALWGGKERFTYSGTVTVSGTVDLELLESLSQAKMWVKSVDVPSTSLPFEKAESQSNGDPAIDEAIGLALEKVYPQILQTAWDHLDPEELALVKKQSQELRERKVY